MPFFRSGSGGTPGRIFNLSGKRSGTACRSGTDRAGHTDAIYNRTRAIPSAASHARTGTRPTAARHTEPESIRQPETTPQPETIQQPKTIHQPEAARQPQTSYQKVEIQDIRKLPKSNWNLCNNRFLLHGFFNYHYLMLKTLEMNGEKQQFLGIPGIYEQPERMMAMLFGFPEFEAAAAVSSDSKDMTGVFGYWMCPLNQD